MTLYEILGVKRNAKTSTIRKAYMRRVKETHPDAGGKREDFEAVQHAWEVLGDPERRERYDANGNEDQLTSEELEKRKRIGATLAMILNNVVAQETSPDIVDVLAKIKMAMHDKLRQLMGSRADTLSDLKKNEKLQARFKYRGQGVDFIRGVLTNQHAALQGNLRMIEEAIEFHKELQEIFEQYEYQTDSPYMSISRLIGVQEGS